MTKIIRFALPLALVLTPTLAFAGPPAGIQQKIAKQRRTEKAKEAHGSQPSACHYHHDAHHHQGQHHS